jgi:SAM-dependent methyltransferase
MRKTYWPIGNTEYWAKRWENTDVDEAMANDRAYPLKQALSVLTSKEGRILEAGCGSGRIFNYFHERGYRITGVDFIQSAIADVQKLHPGLDVEVADIRELPFSDKSFRCVLVASFRSDNVHNRLTDWLVSRPLAQPSLTFHKLNMGPGVLRDLFERAGFEVNSISPIENIRALYRFQIFREDNEKMFNENLTLHEKDQPSRPGRWVQCGLMRLLPNQTFNVCLTIAYRP